MRPAVAAPVSGRARARQADGVSGHGVLGQSTGLGHLLDRMAIAVPAGEIHPRVGLGRVRAQGPFDDTHRFDEGAPIHRREMPQTADAVADRDLIRRLLLITGAHQLLDAQARLRQPLLDPCEWQCQGRPMPLEATCKLRYERRGHGRVRARHVSDHQDQILGILKGDLRQLVRPDRRQIPIQSCRRRSPRRRGEDSRSARGAT